MTRLLNWLIDLLFGSAERTLDDFEKCFPGRCPICALNRAAKYDGTVLPPTRHECPEGHGYA